MLYVQYTLRLKHCLCKAPCLLYVYNSDYISTMSWIWTYKILLLKLQGWDIGSIPYTECAGKPNGFWNLKTSLPAMRRFRTDSHRAQCCLEFSWHGNVSICGNKCFHFALKRYFISKTVRCFWHIFYKGTPYSGYPHLNIWWNVSVLKIAEQRNFVVPDENDEVHWWL